jgi:MFS family permease
MNDHSTVNHSSKPKLWYGYVIVAAGFMIWLVGWGIFTPIFSVFLKPIVTEFGWSRAETTLGLSLAFVIQGILAIFMGRLTDKLGPRIVVCVFGSFIGISYLLMSQITELWQFQVNYAIVAAIGVSTFNIPAMAAIARWFTRSRGLMIGIVQSGVGIGGLIFSPLMAWLAINNGWRDSYVIMGIIAIAGMVISGLFLRSKPEDMGQLPEGSSPVITASAAQKKEGPLPGLRLSQALRTREFWIVACLFGGFGFCRSTYLPHAAAFVQDKGFSLLDGASIVAAMTISSMVGRIFMGRVADKIGNRKTLITSEALTTVSLILGLISGNLLGLYLYAILFGFSWGAQAVLRYSLASESFGLVSIGVVMGTLGLAENIMAALGSYFAGYVFDLVGNYNPAFWAGIAVSLIGIYLSIKKPAYKTQTGY